MVELYEILKNAGVESFILDTQLIICKAAKIRRLDLITKKPVLTDEQRREVMENLHLRAQGKPLQYILGETEFMSLTFEVNEHTLIPRPETELLVELALAKGSCKSVLDIGTGSGAIAVSLAKYAPEANITAIDISKEALAVARRNALRCGVDKQIQFRQMDILTEIPDRYDMVLSNPPYIEEEAIKGLDTNVRDYEPHSALCGGEDGLVFYRRIAELLPTILKEGGFFLLEIGAGQKEAVRSILRPFCGVDFAKDGAGIPRVVFPI